MNEGITLIGVLVVGGLSLSESVSWSQELADKVLHELPEELAAAASFKVSDAEDGLFLDFAVKLEPADYPLVLQIVKRYQGDFVNLKDAGSVS